ncbi:MAG: hypothetical protein ACJ8CB_11420 [Ktedonobacteraceae bacterium]
MKFTLEPGWQWSEHVKPPAGTASCQVGHFAYRLSGRSKIVMDDGTEAEVALGRWYLSRQATMPGCWEMSRVCYWTLERDKAMPSQRASPLF